MKDSERVIPETRTTQQNKALHVYFTLLAESLNDAGLDMRKTLKESIDIPWTPENVKNYLWRPVQNAQLGIVSTTELSKTDIDIVYNTLNRHLADKFGLSVDFPCVEKEGL